MPQTQDDIKKRYNSLIVKYWGHRAEAEKLLHEIREIEQFVEYEEII